MNAINEHSEDLKPPPAQMSPENHQQFCVPEDLPTVSIMKLGKLTLRSLIVLILIKSHRKDKL